MCPAGPRHDGANSSLSHSAGGTSNLSERGQRSQAAPRTLALRGEDATGSAAIASTPPFATRPKVVATDARCLRPALCSFHSGIRGGSLAARARCAQGYSWAGQAPSSNAALTAARVCTEKWGARGYSRAEQAPSGNAASWRPMHWPVRYEKLPGLKCARRPQANRHSMTGSCEIVDRCSHHVCALLAGPVFVAR